MAAHGLPLLGVVLALSACKRSSAPASGGAASAVAAAVSGSAAPVAPPPQKPRCHSVSGGGLALFLGTRTRTPAEDEEGPDDVALPFAPEIGAGAPFRDGFVGSALLPGKGGESAALFVVSPALGAGKTIELGKVHGDVSPPRVAPAGDAVLVAVSDGAPNGTLSRLARVTDPAHEAKVTWGAEIPETADDSEVESLEVGEKVAVLAWDEWDAHAGVEVVRAITFSPEDVAHASPALALSRTEEEAEGPLLARRPGGFWVAWLGRAPAPKSEHGHDAPAPSASADPPAPTDASPTWVVVAPLDESGKIAAAPARVTPKEGHVQSIDLAAAPDGSAIVAYRDDPSVAGTSGGMLRIVVVRSGGSSDARVVDDDDVGPGAPALFASADPPLWLAVPSDAGATALLALSPEGRAIDSLAVEPAVGTATLLASGAGRFLATRPQGKGVEVFVVACEKGPRPTPASP